MAKKTAIIIGAGPGGLTAAYELLTRTDIHPIVLERSEYLGGIARTIEYKGNRLDLGGHRFFSKSDRVMKWWLRQMPIAAQGEAADANPRFLVRKRKSRIYFLHRFFDYPVQPTWKTLRTFGLWPAARIAASYLRSALFPIEPVNNLEDFFINRFGRELYRTFFKSYTEKVWGVPCTEIKAEWGAQRIKKLSIGKALKHYLKGAGNAKNEVETSLIETFLYPKLGSGQMWEEVGRKVLLLGGEIITEFNVDGMETEDRRVVAVTGRDRHAHQLQFAGDYFFSTTSVKELVQALGDSSPQKVRELAQGLQYRDFITVGLLLKRLLLHEPGERFARLIEDNWIYVHESEVQLGRLQIFNNWSPFLVANPAHVWLGVEYFCQQGDRLWQRTDQQMSQLAMEELVRIGVIEEEDVLDSTVARMPKAYPAYFGSYQDFAQIRNHLDGIENLFLIGRNGMHKYNNMDHSMLTAITAVDNICEGTQRKENIWAVNTEEEYHETKR
ncbi:MAG TPA: NAD(P)/FAD-dependent oxidoreductase [Candidatus Acidoferrum sp.]|nr:NAD(P)/FAD-dependent oxidoreductase [Candidatus Acidoferrum sp.]